MLYNRFNPMLIKHPLKCSKSIRMNCSLGRLMSIHRWCSIEV